MYNDLLLSTGGGIIADSQLSPQQGDACVMIGIGGTGINALREVKRAIYTHLRPDEQQSIDQKVTIPTYSRIKFLAIDTDSKELDQPSTNMRDLQPDEWFSITQPHLSEILQNPRMIRQEPNMDWMSTEGISMAGTDGAGGIRQVGRYCLMKKANDLRSTIQQLVTSVKAASGTSKVKIHIFAGISGGTGSGCFLDTCYIARSALELAGTAGSLFGYFFLPDVLLNREGIIGMKAIEDYNKRNGYAAFRELDYLMSLKESNEWFVQNYGSFSVRTQEPPVTMCHLISGTNSNGVLIPNAYEYGMKVVAEYILSYLSQVSGTTTDDSTGLTLDGHLANIQQGVSCLTDVEYGATRKYHILGASSAELPLTHIATYLAGVTYGKMMPSLGRNADDNVVKKIANVLQMSREGYMQKLMQDVPQAPNFVLEMFDLKQPVDDSPDWPQHHHAEPIHQPMNLAFDQSSGFLRRNITALTAEMQGYDADDVTLSNNPSVAAAVFRTLVAVARDPGLGPKIAAELLHNDKGMDLVNVLDGVVEFCTQRLQTEQMYNQSCVDQVRVCATEFNKHRNKKHMEVYLGALTGWYQNQLNMMVDQHILQLIAMVKPQLSKMYSAYFAPLCEMIKNLADTFSINLDWLAKPENHTQQDFCWRIFELSDVQPTLDGLLRYQNVEEEHTNFMNFLFANFESWKDQNEYRISRCINTYMQRRFADLLSRTIDQFLADRYHTNDTTVLASNVQKDILNAVRQKAAPLFQVDVNYVISTANTFEYSYLSVPVKSTALSTAAEKLKGGSMTIRKCLLGDRITCLRFKSGIPLFAYSGVYQLKSTYESDTNKGVHLHEADENWKMTLPTPIPYRRSPKDSYQGDERAALYHRAKDSGVISVISSDRPDEYVVRILPDTTELLENYSKSKYYINGQLQVDVLDKDMDALRNARAALLPPVVPEGQYVTLLNDGVHLPGGADLREDVRIDYFVRFRGLCAAAEASLEQLQRIDDRLEEMQEWKEGPVRLQKKVDRFLMLMANGQITVSGQVNIDLHYEYNNIAGEETLCDLTFPLNDYPLYQAFKSLNAMENQQEGKVILADLTEMTTEMLRVGMKAEYGPTLRSLAAEYDPTKRGAIQKQCKGHPESDAINAFYTTLDVETRKYLNLVPDDAPAYQPAPQPAPQSVPQPAPQPTQDTLGGFGSFSSNSFGGFTNPFDSTPAPDTAPVPADNPASTGMSMDQIVAELQKLKPLLDMGIITQEEFDAKKKQMLGI